VPFDHAGVPPEAEAVGDGVLIGAQSSDEGAERGLTGGLGCGHPRLEELSDDAHPDDRQHQQTHNGRDDTNLARDVLTRTAANQNAISTRPCNAAAQLTVLNGGAVVRYDVTLIV
jgi:hypothetical protein